MLTDLQEIFLVTFSILYGVMLQSLIGFNLFPFGDMTSSNSIVFKEDLKKPSYKKIIKDESRELDDDDRKRIQNRILVSLILFNIIPAVYLGGIYCLLPYLSKNINSNFLSIIGVFLVSFFPLLVYRLFHFLILIRRNTLYEKNPRLSAFRRLFTSGRSKTGHTNALIIYTILIFLGLILVYFA